MKLVQNTEGFNSNSQGVIMDETAPTDQNPKGSTIIAVGATYGGTRAANRNPVRGSIIVPVDEIFGK
jgi:hypothetical protein